MNNLSDWTIENLLFAFELNVRREELKRILGEDVALARKDAENCKTEILRRFPCVEKKP